MSHYTVLGLSTWFELVERIGSEAEAKTYFSETKLVEYNNRTCKELVEAGMLMHLKNWLAIQYQDFKSTGERLRREQVSQSSAAVSSKLYSIEVIRTQPQHENVSGRNPENMTAKPLAAAQATPQGGDTVRAQMAQPATAAKAEVVTAEAVKPAAPKQVVAPKPRKITTKMPAPEKKPAAASMANFFMRQVKATKSELADRKHHS